MAERKGFEPLKRYQRLHDFQSCALDQLSHLSVLYLLWPRYYIIYYLPCQAKNAYFLQQRQKLFAVVSLLFLIRKMPGSCEAREAYLCKQILLGNDDKLHHSLHPHAAWCYDIGDISATSGSMRLKSTFLVTTSACRRRTCTRFPGIKRCFPHCRQSCVSSNWAIPGKEWALTNPSQPL